MKNIALFVTSLLFTLFTTGQNLIPNPSFESINYCETRIPCSPSAWFSVSNIPYGYQNNLPKSINGKHSIVFLIAFTKEIRFYWQTMLLCNLQEGQKYIISFDVYAPNTKFEPEYIGVHLSDTIFRSKDDTLMQIDECKCIRDENPRSLKNGWSEIELSFIATGREKYFLMKNLSKLSNQEILKIAGAHLKYIEYYIDNISLKPANKSISKCTEYKFRIDSLYAANIRHAPIKNVKSNDSLVIAKIPVVVPKADTIVLGKINFNFDSDQLINTSILKRYFDSISLTEIKKIEIIGYTDSIGTESYNLKLSERRAFSVRKYLVDVLKYPTYLITAVGKGIVKEGNNIENNRKVQLIIIREK